MLYTKRHGLVSNIPSHQSLLVPNLSLKPYYVPDRPHEGDDASGQDSIEPELRVSHVANMLNVTVRVGEKLPISDKAAPDGRHPQYLTAFDSVPHVGLLPLSLIGRAGHSILPECLLPASHSQGIGSSAPPIKSYASPTHGLPISIPIRSHYDSSALQPFHARASDTSLSPKTEITTTLFVNHLTLTITTSTSIIAYPFPSSLNFLFPLAFSPKP